MAVRRRTATSSLGPTRAVATVTPLLDTAVWWVDSRFIDGGTQLRDLSGGGRPAVFSGSPRVLPYTGTPYIYIPPENTGNGVQISAPSGTAWTATRTDNSTLTGTTSSTPWVFNVAGSWKEIRSDNGNYICDPARVTADDTGIANSGTSGGTWTVLRDAANGSWRTAVVRRQLLLHATGANAQCGSQTLGIGTTGAATLIVYFREHILSTSTNFVFLGHTGPGSYFALSRYNGQQVAFGANNIVAIPAFVPGTKTHGGRLKTLTTTDVWQNGALINSGTCTSVAYVNIPLNINGIAMEFLAAAIWTRALTPAEMLALETELTQTPAR